MEILNAMLILFGIAFLAALTVGCVFLILLMYKHFKLYIKELEDEAGGKR